MFTSAGPEGILSYYHVRLTERGQHTDEVKTDLDEDTLERQFLGPYRTGEPIAINGRVVTPERLERIRISTSEMPSSAIVSTLRGEDRASAVAIIGGPSLIWRAAERASDVTDQFITGPPGAQVPNVSGARSAETARDTLAAPEGPGDKRSVFVVTGRDSEATAGLIQVLRAMNLRIVEWEHAVAKTGLPNPYIGDVVIAGLRMADAAVVLLTPDDLVALRADLVHDEDGTLERELQGQARPNVFYEAGIADALGRERTIIIEIGPTKPFSDVSGRHVLRYDGTAAKRNALAERLRVAGLEPDTSASDWLGAGDVTSAVTKARTALEAARDPTPPLT